MGKDFAGEFTFALQIPAGKNVHGISRQSWFRIAAKANSRFISAIARINDGGNAELACMRITGAVRIHHVPARRRTLQPATRLRTRPVVHRLGFGNLRRTTGIYRTLIAGVRSRSVPSKTRPAGHDGIQAAAALS